MDWWLWLGWVVAGVGVNLVLVPRLRRRAVDRGLRSGRVPVSARSVDGEVPWVSPRWHTARVLVRDGATVLQRPSDHESQTGPALVFVAPGERALQLGERFRLTPDATCAVRARTAGGGTVELAGSRTAIAWLREQVAARPPG